MDQATGNELPRKKSGVLKWVLLGCGGLLVLGLVILGVVGYFAYRSFNMDPAQAEAAANDIQPLTIPADFKGQFSMSMMGMKMATLESGARGDPNNSRIVLMQMPNTRADQDAVRKQMIDSMERRGGYQSFLNRRPDETFRLRGADIQAQVNSRSDKSNSVQYTLVFQGTSGKTVMLMVSGDENRITHEFVQMLLDSVK